MKRLLHWGVGVVVVVIVIAVVLAFAGARISVKHRETARAAAFNEFVQALSRQGVKVEQVKASVWESFFPGGVHTAAWIKTDVGSLDAVMFSKSGDAEKIRITPLEGESGRFKYSVVLDNWSSVIDASAPELFTMQGNLFVITREPALDTAVKHMVRKYP